MGPTVAVVGAGALGLMAVKNFTEDGFDVTCYESRDHVGGIWKYDPNASASLLSVQPVTVFNTSIYRAAISDFPFPEGYDDFPTSGQLYDYLNKYCDYFGLRKRIQLETRVQYIEREDGKWKVTISKKGEPETTAYFDKVAIAVGTFTSPKRVEIEDQEKFEGSIIHSLEYPGPDVFKGKRVAIMGLHATAADTVQSLAKTAEKVYVTHRKAVTFLPRYVDGGGTFDQAMSLSMHHMQTFLDECISPTLFVTLVDKILRGMSKKAFPSLKPEWNLSPDNASSIAVATPLIGDGIYPHIASGFAVPCSAIARVTGPKSMVLTDGTELEDIDAIVQCTGYNSSTPFFPSEFDPYPHPGETPYLWHNLISIHPDEKIRNSLAFLGHGAITLPGFVQLEAMIMCTSQIWIGNSPLPPLPEMEQWYRDHLAWRTSMIKKYGPSSTFYPAFLPFSSHFKWLNECAGFGLFENFGWCSWKAWKLWWNDKALYQQSRTGLMSPANFRLFDMGKRKAWSGAREQIFKDDARAAKQREGRLKMLEEKEKEGKKVV